MLACGWVWGLAKQRRAWLDTSMYLTTAFLVNLVIRCWLAAESTRQLAEDRHQGTLELLLSTPLRVEEILRGQALALMRQFRGPVLLVLGVECLFMFASMSEDLGGDERFLFWLFIAGMLMLVCDLIALYWVGMWQGLSAKNQSRAISTTLARILVLPWVIIAVLMLFLALGAISTPNSPDPGSGVFLAIWFFIGLAVDVAFAVTARQQLLTQFRSAAASRYAAGAGFWRRLLRK